MTNTKIRSFTLEADIKVGSDVAHAAGTTITIRKPQAGELRGTGGTQALLQGDYVALETLAPRITTPMLQKAQFAVMDPADLTQFHVEVLDFLLPSAAKQAVSPTE